MRRVVCRSEIIPLVAIDHELISINGIDNAVLAEEVLAKLDRVNLDPTQSQFEDTFFEINNNPEGYELLSTVSNIAKAKGLRCDKHWSHVHKPLESTDMHNHMDRSGGIVLSWCYYVKVPVNSGVLIFDFGEFIPRTIVQPVEGMMLIFPSWVNHKVTKNLSNETRISIAGNLII